MDPCTKYAPFHRLWYSEALRTLPPVGFERALLANALIAGLSPKVRRRAGRQVVLNACACPNDRGQWIDLLHRSCREKDSACGCSLDVLDCSSDFCTNLNSQSSGDSVYR